MTRHMDVCKVYGTRSESSSQGEDKVKHGASLDVVLHHGLVVVPAKEEEEEEEEKEEEEEEEVERGVTNQIRKE